MDCKSNVSDNLIKYQIFWHPEDLMIKSLTLSSKIHLKIDLHLCSQNNATTSAFRYSPHHLLSSRAKWLLGMQGNDLNQVKGRMDEAKLEALKAECLRKINKVQKLIEQEQTSMQG